MEWEDDPDSWISDKLNYSGWKFFSTECVPLEKVSNIRYTNVVFMSRVSDICARFIPGAIQDMLYRNRIRANQEANY